MDANAFGIYSVNSTLPKTKAMAAMQLVHCRCRHIENISCLFSIIMEQALMSLTRAIQIFLVQNRHMALGSTNARFFWHPFLKETDQELHLRAGGSVRWRR